MDKNNSSDKMGITRNDEPTRFLSKEEIEELERVTLKDKDTKEHTANPNVKIEDIGDTQEQPSIKKKSKKKSKLKKYIKRGCLIFIFAFAAILGFYLAFTWNTKSQSDDNAKAHQVQQLEQKEQDLSQKQNELEAQIKDLEAQKADLNKQQQDLNQEKSFFTSLIDKVTGKASSDEQKSQDLENQINKAQDSIDSLKSQLNNVDGLKSQASDLKSMAQGEIDKHQDLIDTVKFQAETLLNNILK